MKKILLSLFFFIIFTGQALAEPLILKSTINPNGYAIPILVYSSDKMDVYIPDDMVNFNLFNTKYPQNGNFNLTVYIEIKNEELREKFIQTFKKLINNGSVILTGSPNPDLLHGTMQSVFFDMQNGQAITTKEFFIDNNGNFMGIREGFEEIIPLNNEHPIVSKIASNAVAVLERTMSEYQRSER